MEDNNFLGLVTLTRKNEDKTEDPSIFEKKKEKNQIGLEIQEI